MKIGVVLCCYNGAKYIRHQLNSIIEQSCLPGKLLIYDWGSVDQTLEIIREFSNDSPIPVEVYRLGLAEGVYLSFKRALSHALYHHADLQFFALSDQDDIWEIDKLSEACSAYQSQHAPFAFFSDVSLISADGKLVNSSRSSSSFYFSPKLQSINEALFFASPVVGMTIVASRDIISNFTKIPDESQFMHDWSIMLCAMSMGAKIHYCHKALVKYRQHDGNVLGSSSRKSKVELFFAMFDRIQRYAAQFCIFKRAFPQRLTFNFYSFRMLRSLWFGNCFRFHYRLALTFFLFIGYVQRPSDDQ